MSYTFGNTVKPRLFTAGLLMVPLVVLANPVMIDGQSLIAFGIVAFWALVIESAIATLILVSSGLLIVPSFVALVATNASLFLFAFLPLTSRVPLSLLEFGVVLADALVIKLVTSAPFLQGGDFVGVTWKRALLASVLGNGASYSVGVLATHSPWIAHGT